MFGRVFVRRGRRAVFFCFVFLFFVLGRCTRTLRFANLSTARTAAALLLGHFFSK